MQTAIDGVDITDNGSYKKGCGVGFEGSPRRGGTMSANPPRADASPFASEIRLILIAALLLFTYRCHRESKSNQSSSNARTTLRLKIRNYN